MTNESSTLPLLAVLDRYTDSDAKANNEHGEFYLWQGSQVTDLVLLNKPKTKDGYWEVLVRGELYYLTDEKNPTIYSEINPEGVREIVSVDTLLELATN